jgi:hypothetical protein
MQAFEACGRPRRLARDRRPAGRLPRGPARALPSRHGDERQVAGHHGRHLRRGGPHRLPPVLMVRRAAAACAACQSGAAGSSMRPAPACCRPLWLEMPSCAPLICLQVAYHQAHQEVLQPQAVHERPRGPPPAADQAALCRVAAAGGRPSATREQLPRHLRQLQGTARQRPIALHPDALPCWLFTAPSS